MRQRPNQPPGDGPSTQEVKPPSIPSSSESPPLSYPQPLSSSPPSATPGQPQYGATYVNSHAPSPARMDFLDGKKSNAGAATSSPVSDSANHAGPVYDPNDMQKNWARLVGQDPAQVERVAPRDALDRTAMTKALAGILQNRNDTSPVAIGLFGEWGSGKSSQIQFLKETLGRAGDGAPEIRVVEFNAWEHEKCDNLSAALAQTIVDRLIEQTSLTELWTLARQLQGLRRAHITRAAGKDWKAMLASFGPKIAPFFSAELALAGLFVLLLLLTNIPDIVKWIGGSLATLIAAWKTIEKFVTANLANWFKRIAAGARGGPFGLPDYAGRLGSFHEIRETLGYLESLRVKNTGDPKTGEYLLIIVDDLDRCNVETIKLVLGAVRLVTNMPRVMTMVAVDDKIAFSAVESFYAQF